MEFIERLKTEYGIELNPQQQRAAETVDGAVLLLAVPGSGKTTVLIARLANMLQNHGIKPHNTAVGSGYAGAVCPVFRGGRRAEVFDHSQFLLWGGQTYLDPIPPPASPDAS